MKGKEKKSNIPVNGLLCCTELKKEKKRKKKSQT